MEIGIFNFSLTIKGAQRPISLLNYGIEDFPHAQVEQVGNQVGKEALSYYTNERPLRSANPFVTREKGKREGEEIDA
jgi:hypothetical protein